MRISDWSSDVCSSDLKAELGWQITEDRSGEVEVDVILHDLTGNVVRRLDGGTVTVTPGVTKTGSTTWDGKDRTLLQLVPVGLYYYRVVATDEAGNLAHSGESKPGQLRAPLSEQRRVGKEWCRRGKA